MLVSSAWVTFREGRSMREQQNRPRYLLGILAVVLAILLAGCGSGGHSSTASNGPPTSNGSTTSRSSEPSTTTNTGPNPAKLKADLAAAVPDCWLPDAGGNFYGAYSQERFAAGFKLSSDGTKCEANINPSPGEDTTSSANLQTFHSEKWRSKAPPSRRPTLAF
jgi:hypothetical protein